MADFIQALDGKALLNTGTGLSFVSAAFQSPTYNLPIYLFSVYAFERETSNDSLRYATGLIGLSILLDFIWLLKAEGLNGFIKGLLVILLLLKAPTVFALMNSLRQRGETGFGFGGATGQLSGENTIWSMPGGFTSSAPGGYQAVGGDREDELEQGRPARSAPPPAHPNSHAPLQPPPSGP